MLPVVAIVGAPNVGKSTLFNRLTKRRDALVADTPGVTRDRRYDEINLGSRQIILVDTGGMGLDEDDLESLRAKHAQIAIDEADVILFMVDGRGGLSSSDQGIADLLRRQQKPIILVVNKTDGIDVDVAQAEFFQLGITHTIAISSSHGRGVNQLKELLAENLPANKDEFESEAEQQPADNKAIRLAIIGRPNVGKSTLVNRILGEERVIVYDQPGTTLDSIEIPFEHFGQAYCLIDTAGVRRRGRIKEALEKFSVVKTLQAISDANVICYVIDARDGVGEHDLHLLGFILNAGKSLIIAINKWDGMDSDDKRRVKDELNRRLQFVSYAKVFFISALHGTAVGDLLPAILKAYRSAMKPMATPELTRLLENALQAHQPPLVRGRRIKLKYAHAGGHNPPVIVIHGNQTGRVPQSYQRYLMNFFRQALKLVGTPLQLQFVGNDNPYKDKKNALSERQKNKRRRLKRFVKKKKS